MGELWNMLDAAQSNPAGIPQELIDKKKEEIKSRRVNPLSLPKEGNGKIWPNIKIKKTYNKGLIFYYNFNRRCLVDN